MTVKEYIHLYHGSYHIHLITWNVLLASDLISMVVQIIDQLLDFAGGAGKTEDSLLNITSASQLHLSKSSQREQLLFQSNQNACNREAVIQRHWKKRGIDTEHLLLRCRRYVNEITRVFRGEENEFR